MAAPVSLAFRIAANLDQLRANLQDAQGQLETTRSAMQRMANSLDGSSIIANGNAMVKVVSDLGGAANLTATEQAKVNAVVTEALEKYEALGQEAPPGLRELATATQEAGGYMNDLSDEVTKTAIGFVSAAAVIESVKEAYRTLSDFIGSSMEVYGNAEAAERRLTVAVQAQGYAIPGLAEQYQALGMQYEQTTTYSHTAIDSATALFVQLGNVGPQMMGRAIQAATDLSSGLGIDLNSAVTMLSKAFEGHTTALGRYGIVLDQARVKSEGMDYVLGAIEQKVGGQAQAELDTYSGKIKQLGNAWDDVKERVGGYIANDEVLQAALHELTDDSNAAAKGGGIFSAAWDAIAASAPDWMKALGELHSDLSDLAAVTNAEADAATRMSNVPPPKQFQGTSIQAQFGSRDADMAAIAAQQKEAWKQEAAAAKQYADAVQKVADTMDGADVAKKIKELSDALKVVQQQGPLTTAELTRFADAADKLMKEGGQLPPQLLDITVKFNGLLPAVKAGTDGMGKFGDSITKLSIPIDALSVQSDDLQKKVHDGMSSMSDLGFKVGDTLKETVKDLGNAKQATQEDNKAVAEFSAAFNALGQAAGGTLGQLISLAGSFTKQIDSSVKDFQAADDAFKHGNDFAGVLGDVSGAMGIASVAITGIKDAWNSIFGSAGRDAVVNFANSFGGFDALHAQLNQLGQEGEQLWINLTQKVSKNDTAGAQAAINAITTALNTLNQTNNTTISGLISSIQKFGGSIDPALDPYITKLEQAGQLTQQNADALKALEGDGTPTYQTLTTLQQKYNLTAAQMGPAFDTQQINDNFQTVIDDITTLTKGGGDLNAMMFSVGKDGSTSLSGLGTAIQGDIQAAINAGVAIPDNLKDAAAALIKNNDLFDQQGKAITDVNSLTFGETMQTSMDNLTKTLQDLIATMTGNGPDSLTSALNQVGNMTVHPTIQPNIVMPSGGGDYTYGGAQASGGDYYVTKPTVFVAGEAGPEYASFSGAGGGPTGGGGMRTMQPIVVQVGQRQLLQAVIEVAHSTKAA